MGFWDNTTIDDKIKAGAKVYYNKVIQPGVNDLRKVLTTGVDALKINPQDINTPTKFGGKLGYNIVTAPIRATADFINTAVNSAAELQGKQKSTNNFRRAGLTNEQANRLRIGSLNQVLNDMSAGAKTAPKLAKAALVAKAAADPLTANITQLKSLAPALKIPLKANLYSGIEGVANTAFQKLGDPKNAKSLEENLANSFGDVDRKLALAGITNYSDPATSRILDARKITGFIPKNTIMGLSNTAEDEVLAKLFDDKLSAGDRIASFIAPGILDAGGKVLKGGITGVADGIGKAYSGSFDMTSKLLKKAANLFNKGDLDGAKKVLSADGNLNSGQIDKLYKLGERYGIIYDKRFGKWRIGRAQFATAAQAWDELARNVKKTKYDDELIQVGPNQKMARRYIIEAAKGGLGIPEHIQKTAKEFMEKNPQLFTGPTQDLYAAAGFLGGIEAEYDEDGKFIGFKYNTEKGTKYGLAGLAVAGGIKAANRSEAIDQILGELSIAEGGKRFVKDGDVVNSQKSLYPDWLSEKFRTKDIVEKVMKYFSDGTQPSGKNAKEAVSEALDEISSRLSKTSDSIDDSLTLDDIKVPVEPKLPEFQKALPPGTRFETGKIKPKSKLIARNQAKKIMSQELSDIANKSYLDSIKPFEGPKQLPGPRGYFETQGKPNVTKADLKSQVLQNLNNKRIELEKKIYGSATAERIDLEKGNKRGVGLIGNSLRLLETRLNQFVSKGLASESAVARNISRLAQGFLGELGKSGEFVAKSGEVQGQWALKFGNDTAESMAKAVNYDEKALNRVWEVMDPELSGSSLKVSDLTDAEKEAYAIATAVSDFINDTNYVNGFIPTDVWKKNRNGRYIARAYDTYDLNPPEYNEFIRQAQGKMDLNPFKSREAIDDWKKAEAIKDPAYLLGKRLQQTLYNDELKRMYQWLSGTEYVSKQAKDGFVQLSDHKAYGDLAGKYVRKDILDDINGLRFMNEGANKVYDLLKLYDRNPIRQGYKKIFTVFNPAVRLGNKTGNYVFAWFNGINPATFTKNKRWAKTQIDTDGATYRRLVKDGIVGAGASKSDLVNFERTLRQQYDDSTVKKILGKLETGYQKTDDLAKLAAMKTWLDRGYKYEDAAKKVYDGFQNYRQIGWLYDIGARLPILGNPFVRFKGDLLRMIKNSARDRPVRVIGTVIAWKLFTDIMSKASGESEEDKQTRESRLGAARIPFTDVSLEVQTRWGAVNAARLIGLYAYNTVGGQNTKDDLSEFMPIENPMVGANGQERLFLGQSPDIGPILSVMTDTDFRGKKISDPDYNKYTGSNLTPTEQNINRLKFLQRSYTPTAINSAADVVSSLQGKPDFYGRTRDPLQAALRVYPGVKLEQFGPKEAAEQRQKNAKYEEYRQNDIKQKISSTKKELLKGELSEGKAAERISYWNKEAGNSGGLPFKVTSTGAIIEGTTVSYMDDGTLKNIDISFSKVKRPELTGSELLDKKIISNYKRDLSNAANDVEKLYQLGIITAEQAETMLAAIDSDYNSFGSGGGKKLSAGSIGANKPPAFKSTGSSRRAKLKVLSDTSAPKLSKLSAVQRPQPKISQADLDKLRNPL